jgi:hypothetical protein
MPSPESTLAPPSALTRAAALMSAQVHAVPVSRPSTLTVPWAVLARVAMLALAFVVYAASFSDLPVIERRHSVLGDADAANYAVLLRGFSLAGKMGNEYNTVHRSLGDNAQKHKVHHVLYAAAGSAELKILAPAYEALGLSPRAALYGVNALLAVVNLLLLTALMRGMNPSGNPLLPFLAFFALTLSNWVFYSVPESWPFSATLVLAYLLALHRARWPAAALGAALGIVMLNNVFLAALFVLVPLALLRRGDRGWRFVGRTTAAGFASLGAWAGGLWALSAWDGSFRPDRFVAFTIWFKQFTGATLPRTDPYVWKSAFTNLFVTSVVSSQPDPGVPQEALLATLHGSPLGIAATLAWAALAGVLAWSVVRASVTSVRAEGWAGAVKDEAADLWVWCAAMLGVTVVLFYPSGFLYSTVVIPAIALALCRHLDLRVMWQRVLLYGTLALMLANNLDQVLRFRAALRVLS